MDVVHLAKENAGKTAECGETQWSYITTEPDDVTCRQCINELTLQEQDFIIQNVFEEPTNITEVEDQPNFIKVPPHHKPRLNLRTM